MISDHSRFVSSRFTVIVSLAVLCGIVAIAKELPAQTTETPEESPDAAWMVREERAADFHTHMLQGNAVIVEAHALETTLRDERMTQRLECLDIIRRSNKDRVFTETLRCFRKEAEITAKISAARADALKNYPNVTRDGASLHAARADLLQDAYATVLQAIDAGVYESMEELAESRANLETKYRAPYHTTTPRVSAERTLAWIAHLLLRLHAMESEATSDALESLQTTQECFVAIEAILESALASEEHQKISDALSQQLSPLKACSAMMEESLSNEESATGS